MFQSTLLLVIGCIILGIGVGLLFHNALAGALIGLGEGIAFMALTMYNRANDRSKR